MKKNYFELRVTDNDLYGRVLAKVVLSVIVKSSVTTSRVSQNPPFAASLVVVV